MQDLLGRTDLDLKVDSVTYGLLRLYAKDRDEPSQACFLSTHGIPPLSTFPRYVAMHRGDHKVQDFTCIDKFLKMAFAQLTYRDIGAI